jgi:transposase-like protein
MVLEHQQDYESQWEAICSVAEKLGPTAETVRKWVRRAEIDGGVRPGVTTVEAERIRQLERENRELRRANEILKAALAFFGGSSTRNRRGSGVYDHRNRRTEGLVWGVEPICGVVQVAPASYYAAKRRPPSARAVRDEELRVHIAGCMASTTGSTEPTRCGPSSTVRASGLLAAPWSG